MAYEWINEKTGEPLNKTKMVDGEIVDLTSEEISKIETERETAIEQQAIDKDNEKTNKENKVSAYRKMDMTDDEILAIDSTLEEYL
jgi:hypothetical protein